MTKRYGNVEAANTHVISMNTDAWSTNLKLAECPVGVKACPVETYFDRVSIV